MSRLTLRECANFVRSKNAGPFTITIDIFFPDAEALEKAWTCESLSPANVAAVYNVDPANIQRYRVEQAKAMKFSMPRPIPAGDIGDTDVAGGQQFYPLLELPII